MANLIYSDPNYAMGATEDTPDTRRQAEAAIKSMRGSLKSWLKKRKRMNEYAAGQVKAPALFRSAKPLPPRVVAATLRRERLATEQDLAETLYNLLVECGVDSAMLPEPNVAKDQNAAAKLATIAIQGKTPTEAASPQAQGIVWFVLAIPVAGVVLVLSQMIKSKADIAKAKEERLCKESGACTDEGFWLKMASLGVIGWLAWDKFGLREAVASAYADAERRKKRR